MASKVTVECAECQEQFTYMKRSNVPRKFCDDCRVSRVQASKDRSLNNKKEERREEEIARAKLDLIPDMPVNPAKLVDMYINGKRT